MRLKVVTTVLVVFGLLLLMAWPLVLGNRPPASNRPQLAVYSKKLAIYTSVLVVTFFGSAVGAWLIMRQTRKEYLEASRRNFEELLEGTLRDHARKSESTPDA